MKYTLHGTAISIRPNCYSSHLQNKVHTDIAIHQGSKERLCSTGRSNPSSSRALWVHGRHNAIGGEEVDRALPGLGDGSALVFTFL